MFCSKLPDLETIFTHLRARRIKENADETLLTIFDRRRGSVIHIEKPYGKCWTCAEYKSRCILVYKSLIKKVRALGYVRQ